MNAAEAAEAMRTRNDVLQSQPFLLDLNAVNSIGQCSKACYLAIGWLLDNAAELCGVEANHDRWRFQVICCGTYC